MFDPKTVTLSAEDLKIISSNVPLPENTQRRRLTLDDYDLFDKAVAKMRADIEANPNDAQAHYNLGGWLLSSGDLSAEAWEELVYRLLLPGMNATYDLFPVPIYDGCPLLGKRVLVWLEQGVGDQIQAASMLSDLIAEAGHVTVYCNRRLQKLLQRSFPKATILRPGQLNDFSHFDYQFSFSDLGGIYRTSFDAFPKHSGYLTPDPAKVAELRKKYEALANGRKIVGISWNSANPNIGAGKSINCHSMAYEADREKVFLISLQYKPELTFIEYEQVFIDPDVDQMWDMDLFAAQVAAMDQVVSTSNTTLHVAGAVGAKTLALLPRGGCRNWYWFNERADCPWYPSVELVRQHVPDNWTKPLERMREWLK